MTTKATGSKRRLRPARRPTLAGYLLEQLVEDGVETIFGIPGDFILRLCEVIDEHSEVELRTLSHEPGVGFAASGAARAESGSGKVPGVACVTYGAGALNMVNPVAAAYAEKTPLVVLTGGPSAEERARGILVHHQVKSFDSQLRVFREVTQYQAVLDDPDTAAEKIRYALDVCREFSLPVYLQIPRDMVDTRIRVQKGRSLELSSSAGAIEEAAKEIRRKIDGADRPVLAVGVEIHRFGLADRAVEVADRLGLPVVSTFMGRGTFPDDHPRFAGVYLGPASPPGVRELVEDSDCLLLLGALLSDTNMGVRLSTIDPRRCILAVSRTVQTGFHRYEDVPLAPLVEAILEVSPTALAVDDGATVESFPDRTGRPPFMRADEKPSPGPLRVASMIAEINRFFAEEGEMPVVTDTGDCLFCSHEIDTQLVVASAYYATMGFGVPAALGFEAAGGPRPLVLVGDGGFQMTGTELAQAVRWDLSPIVVLMNNGSWEMLQSFLPTNYNELLDWRYATMSECWGIPGVLAPTAADFRKALREAKARSGPTLIEVPLAKGDISNTLHTFTRSVGNTPPPPK